MNVGIAKVLIVEILPISAQFLHYHTLMDFLMDLIKFSKMSSWNFCQLYIKESAKDFHWFVNFIQRLHALVDHQGSQANTPLFFLPSTFVQKFNQIYLTDPSARKRTVRHINQL